MRGESAAETWDLLGSVEMALDTPETGESERTPTPCAEHMETRGENRARCSVKSEDLPKVNPQSERSQMRSQIRSESARKCVEEAQ